MARNILVVEDDRNISELIRMYLEKEGFEVRLAYDGGKAVEEYDKRAPDGGGVPGGGRDGLGPAGG